MRLSPGLLGRRARSPGTTGVTPGSPSDVDVNRTASVPKKAASTAAAAPLNELCPDVYAGNGGVGSSGVQRRVGLAGPRSTGRHTSNRYLHSQHDDRRVGHRDVQQGEQPGRSRPASAPGPAATAWAIRFQCPGGVTVPSPSAQKCATSVCSRPSGPGCRPPRGP